MDHEQTRRSVLAALLVGAVGIAGTLSGTTLIASTVRNTRTSVNRTFI